MRARLDKLRDQPPSLYSEDPVYISASGIETKHREVLRPPGNGDLESRVLILTPEQDIQRRLARLRGEQFCHGSQGA